MRQKRGTEVVAASGSGVPPTLLRFVYADWADEAADGVPGPHWPQDREAVGLFYGICAHNRYMQALHEWQRAHGVSYDDWQRLQADHGIGVAVHR